MKEIRRMISGLLVLIMIISMIPVQVLAMETEDPTEETMAFAVETEAVAAGETTGESVSEITQFQTIPVPAEIQEELSEAEGVEILKTAPVGESAYTDDWYMKGYFNNVLLWGINTQGTLHILPEYETYLPAHRDEPAELAWGFSRGSDAPWRDAFYKVYGLVVHEGITQIGDYAFADEPDCRLWLYYDHLEYSRLKNAQIASTVSRIGTSAFRNSGLQTISFLGDAPAIAANAFENVRATAYFPISNPTWTGDVLQDYGGDITWAPVGDEAEIAVSIRENTVYDEPLICGSVYPKNGQIMVPELVLSSTKELSDVSMKITLPEGFSFNQQSLSAEKALPVGSLQKEQTKKVEFYPIFIDVKNHKDEYVLTVEISGKDRWGRIAEFNDEVVFYRPSAVKNEAQSLCGLTDDTYTFSLDSACGSGTVYNQETARLCAMMSNMAYTEADMKAFLINEMGFSEYETHTGINLHKIARYYASKRIIVDGEIKNLVYVICRGTADLKEWVSNICVMSEDVHHGFNEAAKYVKNELNRYCEKQNYTADDTVILVTGHSRGGAVANLIGNWLNTSAGLADKENINVYTFEAPTVDRKALSEQSAHLGNENIFNFLYYQDIVSNAPSMKYFGRYGKTVIWGYSLAEPGSEVHSDGFGNYDLPVDGSNYTILELINTILNHTDTNNKHQITYSSFLLKGLIEYSEVLYGNYFELIVAEILHAHNNCYYQAITGNVQEASYKEVELRTENAYAYLFEKLIPLLRDEIFLLQQFKCPINLYVYNTNGEMVASIIDKTVTCDDDNLLVYVDGETLNVGIFEDEYQEYTIKLEGYDSGMMKHCIQTVSVDGLQSVQIREKIPITNGEVLEVNDSGYVSLEGEDEADILAAYEKYEDEAEMEWVLENLTPRDLTEDDAIYLLWHTLFPEEYPVVERAVDYNDDGEVTDADALMLLWHISFPEQYPLQ